MPKASWGNIEDADSIWDDELEDFPVYDGDLPPKGVYRLVLKSLRLKKNKNNDPMLNALLIINEPASSKKSQYNGKDVWANLNVTRQGAPWVNNFISAIVPENKVAAVRKAFWAQKVMVDKEEPPNILSIGAVKIEPGKLLVSAQCGHKLYNNDTDLDAKRFFRPSDTTLNEDGSAAAAAEDEEEWEEETESEETDEEPEGDVDEEFDARVEELEAMDRSGLLKAAKAVKVSVKRGTPETNIIDAILAAEFPEEDDDEEPEEDEEEPEPEEEEEEEVEPEPEPPKATRTRRTRPATAPKAEEPPARARTGTRRRKAGNEPPF